LSATAIDALMRLQKDVTIDFTKAHQEQLEWHREFIFVQ
jgi:hypothetical protein